MVSEERTSKKVCVIGAGPSGLVAARELRKEGHTVVVLEQNRDIGGQWLYDPNVEAEHPMGTESSLKVHSSIYASLRLQSARETMGYTDFPFVVKQNRDTRRYPGHEEYLLYLQDFCERFKLRDMIRFNARVTNVEMLNYPSPPCDLKWAVGTNAAAEKEVYDAVVVANGHYSQPRLPKIQGMDSWKRRQMHSHVYRVPDSFKNEVVVVVGSSFSGQEISIELANTAKEVHISARSPNIICEAFFKAVTKWENLHLRPQIESLHDDGRVVFGDGSWTTADTVIYCTGYSYSFPFLDTKGIVAVDDERVGPLYEHTFPPSLAPSLSFIGIPAQIIGLPFFESQAKWIAQLLSGKRTLPAWDDMMQSIKDFYHELDLANIPKDKTHFINDFIEYADKYANYADSPHLEEWRKALALSVIKNAVMNYEYRDFNQGDEELLQSAYNSPHFTQFQHEDSTL